MAGENLSMTYSTDAVVSTRARCVGFAYGYAVVATESHAREHRAMYPHQRALGKFKIDCQFKNYGEYEAFMSFFYEYAHSWLHPPTARPYYSPGIHVMLTSDDRTYSEAYMGVPIAGVTRGDHVGNVAYPQSILFQMIQDPLDPGAIYTGNDNNPNLISQPSMGDNYKGGAEDDTTKFFYPFSSGSEDSSVKASDIYGMGPAVANAPPPAPLTPGGAGAPGSAQDAFNQLTHTGQYGPFGQFTGLPGS